MSQSGGPGASGQPPGPPDWQSAPQQPAPPAPGGWQSAPQQPQAPASGGWQSAPLAPRPPSAPPPPAAPAWQSAPQQPTPPAPAAWQSAPKAPQPPNVPPPPPPSWTANLTSTVPTPGPAGFVYADVPNRVVAYIIDAIILGLISGVVFALLGGATTSSMSTNGATTDINIGPTLLAVVLDMAISAAYFSWMWSAQRATIGMKILGLQIGNETDGRSITLKQALVRWLVIGLPLILSNFVVYLSAVFLGALLGLFGIVWLLVLLWSIAKSATKQGYHDKYAHTIMVKSARRAA